MVQIRDKYTFRKLFDGSILQRSYTEEILSLPLLASKIVCFFWVINISAFRINYLRAQFCRRMMKSKPLCLSLLITLVSLFTVHSQSFAQEEAIRLAVAANLLSPMQQLKEKYESQYQNKLILIPGSSGKLTAQIMNGAPYDIFLSADMMYPNKLLKEGYGKGEVEIFTKGKLAFWSKKEIDKPLKDWLNQSHVKSVAIAQPELAPYGRRARGWLQENKLWGKIKGQIIYGESIGQVNQYIRSGAVDAAFTAVSARHAPELRNRGHWMEIENSTSATECLNHGLLVLQQAKASQAGIQHFLLFLRSEDAQQLLQNFGYEKVN